MVLIKIIRHSERLDFTNKIYWLICFGHYWADSPLTVKGHEMANNKGKQMITHNFNPKYIYTSPYTRTMATSTEIKTSFPYAEIIIEPLLSEYQPFFKHRINLYPSGIPTTYEGQDTAFDYPETYNDFSRRIQYIISKLIDKHNDDLIVVTHGEVLKVFIAYIRSIYPDLSLDPGTTPYLTTLTFEYDKDTNIIIEGSIEVDFYDS